MEFYGNATDTPQTLKFYSNATNIPQTLEFYENATDTSQILEFYENATSTFVTLEFSENTTFSQRKSTGNLDVIDGFRWSYTLPIIVIFVLFGIGDNGFVIAVIAGETSLRNKATNLLLMNQSIVDALVCLFILLSHVIEYSNQNLSGVHGFMVCYLWRAGIPLFTFVQISTLNLVLINVERMVMTVRPWWHRRAFTPSKILKVIVLMWGLAFAIDLISSLSLMSIDGGVCVYRQSVTSSSLMVYVIFFSVYCCIMPVVVMVFCYIAMICTFRKRPRTLTEKSLYKTLATLTTAFMSCYLCGVPYIILILMNPEVPISDIYTLGSYATNIQVLAYAGVLCNAWINPIIYSFRYEEFKEAAKKLYRKLFKRNLIHVEELELARVEP